MIRQQTAREEAANSILHGIGALAALVGLAPLLFRALESGGGVRAVAAYTIFAAALVIMFLVSTIYHAVTHAEIKRILRILDHSAIYLLIAGTYTPFCLLSLRGVWGWSFFFLEWGLAAAGITLYAVSRKFMKKVEVAVYIVMGWAIVVGWFPLRRALPRESLILLAAGGIAYTLGTFWYARPRLKGAHVAWHVFVLAGAVCHWCSIWFMSISS